MGSGKTEELLKYLSNKTFLYVSFRVALAKDFKRRCDIANL